MVNYLETQRFEFMWRERIGLGSLLIIAFLLASLRPSEKENEEVTNEIEVNIQNEFVKVKFEYGRHISDGRANTYVERITQINSSIYDMEIDDNSYTCTAKVKRDNWKQDLDKLLNYFSIRSYVINIPRNELVSR